MYEKYTTQGGRNPKSRDLAYCSHIDAYIYQLYAHKMTKKYNELTNAIGIGKCVTAYRNTFPGQCNIDFAYDVFKFIRKTDSCFIIIGDFTKFFDRLDHNYLKEQCCKILGVTRLPEDYYKVFKSITKYSWFESDDLIKLTNSKNYKEFKTSKRDMIFSNYDEFRKAKKNHLKKNKKKYGIPQGSPLSALFANVYMLEFDKAINNFATSNNGLYRRYSDDFIIVLPSSSQKICSQWNYVDSVRKNIPNLGLQPSKTKVFRYENGTLANCDTLLLARVCRQKKCGIMEKTLRGLFRG